MRKGDLVREKAGSWHRFHGFGVLIGWTNNMAMVYWSRIKEIQVVKPKSIKPLKGY